MSNPSQDYPRPNTTKARNPAQPSLLPARLPATLTTVISAPVLALTLVLAAWQPALAQTTVNICNRTDKVEDALLTAIGGSATCSSVTTAALEGITGTLDLSSQTIGTLLAGDFANLAGVETLNLSNNQLTTVPAGIFTGLDAMTSLDLSGNEFASLPAGLFTGLTVALTTLDLSGQFSNDDNTDDINIFNVPLQLSLDPATLDATVTLATGAPAALRVNLDQHGHNSSTSPSFVTIAIGATSVTARLAQASGQTLSAALSAVAPTVAGATGFTLTTGVTGICTRTAQVQTAILARISGVSNCAHVTAPLLKGITGLFAVAEGSTFAGGTLQAGDFAGLSSITNLQVRRSPSLTTLPSGLLDGGLDSLDTFNVIEDKIDNLAADLLHPVLDTLTVLHLASNEIATIPDGFFANPNSNSAGLNLLALQEQFDDADDFVATVPTYHLPLTVAWDSGTATVTMPSGAPGTMTIKVRATNASPTDYDLTMTAGDTTATVGIAAVDDNSPVTVGFADVVTTTVRTLYGVDFSVDLVGGICDRTAAVQTALMATAQVTASNCAAVTTAMLNAITTLDLASDSISALKAGDFADLTALDDLDLSGNSLTTLPAGLFTGLTDLDDLDLSGNSLTALTASGFTGLTALTDLNLSGNGMTTLPASLFSNVTALTTLNLSGNQLAAPTAGIFTGLTALTDLDLSGNGMTAVAADLFSNVTALTDLNLSENKLTPTGLPATTLNPLASLTTLNLSGNELTTLPDDIFSGLDVDLTNLDISNQFNDADTGPSGDGTPTQASITLWTTVSWSSGTTTVTFPTGAPAAITVKLTAANTGTAANTLTIARGDTSATATIAATDPLAPVTFTFTEPPTLPSANTYTGLNLLGEINHMLNICDRTPALEAALLAAVGGGATCDSLTTTDFGATLDLSGQSIGSLKAGDFANLDSVTTLNLSDNQLTTVPASLFAELINLTSLDLSGNQFASLPAGLFTGLAKALTTLNLSGQFRNDANTANIDNFDVPLAFDLTGTTATVTLATGAPAALRVNLDQHGNTSASPSFVDIALGATTGTATLVQASGATLSAELSGEAPTVAGATGLTLTTGVTGICDRTPQVYAAILGRISGVSNCAHVTDTLLKGIAGTIRLGSGTTGLKAGDFAGLSSVTQLQLTALKNLTSLPSGLLTGGLDSLQIFDINESSVTALPADLLQPVKATLNTAWLGRNELGTVPDGFFAGVTGLTRVQLVDQFNDNPDRDGSNTPTIASLDLPITATWSNGMATVTMPTGTPTQVTFKLRSSNSSDEPTVTLAGGATSASVAMAATDGNLPVVVGFADLPTVTNVSNGIQGVGFPVDLIGGICDRTAAVQDALVAAISGAASCATVTTTMLNAVTTLNLAGGTITALKAGDFAALTALTSLNLSGNQLTAGALTAGLFTGLTDLDDLDLSGNGMTTLPASLFSNITGLTDLDLSGNSLTALTAGDFTGLTALTDLDLSGNGMTTVPANFFSNVTALTSLNLSGNRLASGALTAGGFTGLTALTDLDLSGNGMTAVAADLFSNVTALTDLNLSENKLTTTGLPATTLNPLASLTTLNLSGNELASLPDDIFSGLDVDLTNLDISNQFNDADTGPSGDSTPTQASITLWTTVSWSPPNTTTVTVPTGAPATITVKLTAANTGTAPHTLTIARGATSATATIAATDPLAPVTFTFTEPPTLPSANTYTGLNLLGEINHALNICDRTPALEAALLAAVGGGATCDSLTTTDFGATLNLSGQSIGSLKAGDFANLDSVTTLNLSDNQLTTVPAGLFAELINLTSLDLSGNQFRILPAGLFTGLAKALTKLNVSGQFRNVSGTANIDSIDVPLTLDLTGTTATVTLATGAPTALRVNLDQHGHNTGSSPSFVIIPLGATSVTATLVQASGQTLSVALSGAAPTVAGATGLTLTTGATGICDRTPQVQTAILARIGVSNCAHVTAPLLKGITGRFTLVRTNTSELKAVDFAGLSSVTELQLTFLRNLTSLPSDLLTGGLDSLQIFDINESSVTALPANLLQPVKATLNTAWLGRNEFRTVPDGFFAGVTGLTRVELADQFNNKPNRDDSDTPTIASLDLPITATWSNGMATVTMPTGTPTRVKFKLRSSNSDDEPIVTLAGGDTSASVAMAATNGNLPVVVGFAAPPFVTNSGTVLGVGFPVNLIGGICDRTAAVQDALVAAISGAASCGTVTTTMLNTVTSLDLADDDISALKAGDFAGLTALTSLDLSGNQLAALPAAIFTGLSALTTLDLSGNKLTAPTASGFTGLTGLTTLDLSGNKLTALTAGGFTGLTGLTTLDLSTNGMTGLTAGGFTGLTALTTLDLSGNKLTAPTASGFTGLTALATLDLSTNGMTAVAANLFSNVTALTDLNLSENKLRSSGLPAATLNPLASLTTLNLSGNELAALPDGIFSGLDVDLTNLNVSDQFNDADTGAGGDGTPTQASITLWTTVSWSPPNTTTVTVPTGAPAELTVELTAANTGTAAHTLTIARAATSASVAMTATDPLAPVTLSFTETPTLPSANTYTGLRILGQVINTLNICDRTPALEAALLKAVSRSNPTCDALTPTDFGEVLDLSGQSIGSLQAGDFANLDRVKTLNLSDNQLTTVPAGIFAELISLTSLDLSGNQFATLPAGLFTGLTVALTTLDLSGQFRNDANTANIDNFDVPLQFSLNATTKLATVTLATGAPAALRVNLDQHGHNTGTSPSFVTIAAGATSVTATLVQASGQTLSVALSGEAPTVAGATGFTLTTGVTGICDRTEQVYTAILGRIGVSNCAHVTAPLLKGITGLLAVAERSAFAGGTLLAGDFAGLSNVGSLLVRRSPSLTTLPSGLLDGLDSLQTFNVIEDKIDNLAADLLHPVLDTLRVLHLSGNEITTIPDGFFANPNPDPNSRAGLNLLALHNQFLAADDGVDTVPTFPLPLTVAWDSGTAMATVTMPSGAPGTMTIKVRATNASSTDYDLTMSAGDTTATVAIAAVDDNSPVTVGFATVPTADIGTMYGVAFPVDLAGGICDRTTAVHAALVAAISSAANCTIVTTAMLNTVTSLDLADDDISALKAGDLAGLTALTSLDLSGNGMTTLPAGLFTGLSTLTTLNLSGNSLDAPTAAIFTGLTALTSLDLSDNGMSTLPASLFSNITTLTTLNLSDNELTALTAAIFTGLTALTDLDLSGNGMSTLPASFFSNITTLTTLNLSDNKLATPTAGDFTGLTALTDLDLSDNGMTTLPANLFSNITALTTLNLSENKLTTAGLPAATLNPLASLTTLNLSGNELATLPDGIFSGLDIDLTNLNLSDQFNDDDTGAGDDGTPTQASITMRVTATWNSNTATVAVPTAAPAAITVKLTAANTGTAAHILTIARAATSATATMTPIDRNAPVTLTFTKNPVLPSANTYTGLNLLGAADRTLNICDRTPALEAAMLAAARDGATCDALSIMDFGGTLDLSGQSIGSLKAGDFANLAGITTLNLSDNQLTTVPAGLFAELDDLTTLNLSGNRFQTLPAGLFTGLAKALTNLNLSGQFRNVSGTTNIDNFDVPLTFDLTGTTATVTLATGAPEALTVNLDLHGHDTGAPSPTSVTIAIGETSGTATLVPAIGQTLSAELSGEAPTVASATGFTLTTGVTGICTRTEQVQTAILARIADVSNCALVTDTQLKGITGLFAVAEGSTFAGGTLRAGDFAGLSNVGSLRVRRSPSLTTLPSGLLDGLDSLGTFNVIEDKIADLPADLLHPVLDTLRVLHLAGNEITTIPDGFFATPDPNSNSAGLITLALHNQFLAADDGVDTVPTLPLPLTVAWKSGTATVTMPSGAPGVMTILLRGINTTPAEITATMAAGATTATVDLAATGNASDVRVGFATAPTTAIGTVYGATFPVDLIGGICDRTAAVQDALIATSQVTVGICSTVTTAMLNDITILDLAGDGISALKAGDFADLTALDDLDLSGNSLDALPAGTFTDLGALTTLNLSENKLTAAGLPNDLLDPLVAMTSLNLGGNEFRTLPDGIFTGLTKELLTLNLSDQFNDSDDNTPLQTNLTIELTLLQNGNEVIASIPTGAPANLAVNLTVTGDAMSSSPESVAIGVGTASGTAILLPNSGALTAAINATTPVVLSAVATSHTGMVFEAITSGICPRTSALRRALIAHSAVTVSDCADVNTAMLQGITGTLDLSGRGIVALRPGDLADLTGVTTLNLRDNQLTKTTVPASIFSPLTSLTSLDLSGNQFTALPDNLFQGLSGNLQTLDLAEQFRNDANTDNIDSLEVTLTLGLASNVATVTIPTAAPRTITVGLVVEGATQAGSPTSVRIAAGATTGTATLLPQASATLVTDLDRANPPALPGTYSGLTLSNGTTDGFCGRTLLVRAILLPQVSAATCEEVTDTMLGQISVALDMSGMGISELQPDDLAGLDSATEIDLSGNSLTALPAGIFDDLDAVTDLDLSGNKLTAAGLPNDLLDPLVAMTSLDLGRNEIRTLPDGIFTGLTKELITLNLANQFIGPNTGPDGDGTPTQANLTVYLTLIQNGNEVTVSIPAGAPANLTVNLAVTGDAMSGSPESIVIGVGTDSGTDTLEPNSGALIANFAATTPVALSAVATSHNGIMFKGSTSGICARTRALQTVLLAHPATASDCADVTPTELRNITGELNLSGQSIAALHSGDFTDLTGVTALNLSGNNLAALPAGIFTGLTALTSLNLSGNQLAALTADLFTGLTGLTSLNLRDNRLTKTTVPASILSPLTGLTSLDLSGNQIAALPDDLFKGLSGDLQTLDLSEQFRNDDNTPNIDSFEVVLTLGLASDDATVTIATGAPTAITVNLLVEGATQADSPTSVSIEAGATTGTATLLPQSGTTLVVALDRTNPPALPATYSGLTLSNGTTEGFCGRSLLVRAILLPQMSAATCEEVTDTMLGQISVAVDMSGMGISELQPDDLAGLDSATEIDLSGNSIAELPEGIFADLDAVTDLDLSGNQFAELPAGIFDDLDAVTDIDLSGNQLKSLPDGIFSDLDLLANLDLTGNDSDGDGNDDPLALEVKLSVGVPPSSSVAQSLSPASADSPFQLQAIVPTEAGMTVVQVELPLPLAASVIVYLQTDTGTPYSITSDETATITDANVVAIDAVCFDETPTDTTGTGCTGIDTTADTTFKGVQLASGFALVVDAFPTFDAQIANQKYPQQVAIDPPLQLPQAGLTLPPGGTPPSLTYSLTATITGGEEAQLAGTLPAGLAFSANTRRLSGTPAAAGTYAMTYTATDDNGDTAKLNFAVEVTVIPVNYDALHAQILSHLAMTVADSAGQAVSDRIDRMFSGQKPRFSTNDDGSEFDIPLSGRDSIFTLWLQNSSTDLSLKGGDFNWSGDVSGTQFGFDWRSDNSEFLVGLMLQNLDGKFNYSSNVANADGSGYYSTPVDSEHVYFAWMPGGVQTSNWLNVWGMLGSGSGSLAMTGQNGVAMRGSTDLSMTHLGFSMTPVTRSDWLSLRVRGEMTISSLTAGGGGVTPLKVSVTRQRALVEPSLKDLIADDRHQLVLAGELGFRSDSTSVKGVAKPGGVPEGVGTELGMKLSYNWRNFDVQMGFRQLSTSSGGHKYNEDGFYFSLTMGTLFGDRGWTVSLRPTWGNTGSGVTQLWQADKVAELGSGGSVDAFDSGSMQTQVSYGMLSPFGGSGLLTPYSTVQTSDSGPTNATFGMNLSMNSGWQLNWEYSGSGSAAQSAAGVNSSGATSSGASGAFKLGAKLDF